MTETTPLRESLAALEHDQWMEWSRGVAEDLANIEHAIKHEDHPGALKLIDRRLRRWASYWVSYDALREDIKNHDRKWADKVMETMKANRTCDHCASCHPNCLVATKDGQAYHATIDGTNGRYRWVKDEVLPM